MFKYTQPLQNFKIYGIQFSNTTTSGIMKLQTKSKLDDPKQIFSDQKLIKITKIELWVPSTLHGIGKHVHSTYVLYYIRYVFDGIIHYRKYYRPSFLMS